MYLNAAKYAKANKEGIIRLRELKLKSGYPFMINSKELPARQAYLEYPDGSIKIVTIEKGTRDFKVIKVLNKLESSLVKARYLFL